LLAIVFAVVLHATPLGRAIFAIGAGQEAAFFAAFASSGSSSGCTSSRDAVRVRRRPVDAPVRVGAVRLRHRLELYVVTIVLLGGVSIFGGRGTILGVVLAVAVLGTLQTALTADLIPAQDQNIVVGALLLASVILPNGRDIYQRARARLRSAEARRHRAEAAPVEGP
jgi:Ribose/xylose/arabinose/galactoside ABC-type transport systems, permease components